METLVMSQVAPGIGQHSYSRHHHHTMVGGDAHHDDETSEQSSQPEHRRDDSSSTLHAAADATAERTPVPHHHQDENARIIADPSASTPSALRNHNRGFDQSGFPLTNDSRFLQSSPSSPRLQPTYRSTRSLGESEATSPSRIKVRDLSHIQSFASEEYLARPGLGNRTGSFPNTQYEISSMPVADIIEMVAGLLTKITTTNDRQHEHMQRPIQTSQDPANLDSQTSCVLAFHGKNIPSITILSYLSRIHKYCPTTYEVFLSLLVYFDRMTDSFSRRYMEHAAQQPEGSTSPNTSEVDSSRSPMDVDTDAAARADPSHLFAVDSYNIHRLVIAGVTCASKFFSDVFYTNSRYAKVGGLPLVELNNLELHFLLLNDFRLSIPVEELEAYGTMLVEFYAREIVAQQQTTLGPSDHRDSGDEVYMRGS